MLGSPLGFVARAAGWFTAEVGRQPWIVYGVLRTADARVAACPAAASLASLVLFVVVYAVVFGAGVFYICQARAAGPDGRRRRPRPEGQAACRDTSDAHGGGKSMTGPAAAQMTEILPVILPLVWAAIMRSA